MATTTKENKAMAPANPARQFRMVAAQIASSLLTDWVGKDRAGEATGRISAALAASAASAKNPSDFYQCTVESIGQCIAVAALTEIMPGTGAAALAYVIPQRPRANEKPQLQFMFSHRGLNALARRTGQTMIAIPIGHDDKITFDDSGEVRVVDRDIDNPPTDEKQLRGIIIAVREISNGVTICRGWVPKKLIDQRKAVSRSASSSYSPWAKWYVEMAMKTAMHYAIARGWCVIDDAAATRALSAEAAQDLIVVSDSPRKLPESPAERLGDGLEARLGGNGSDTKSETPEPSAVYTEIFGELAAPDPTAEFLQTLLTRVIDQQADMSPAECEELSKVIETKLGELETVKGAK